MAENQHAHWLAPLIATTELRNDHTSDAGTEIKRCGRQQ
jgi:hypothetical protein